MTRNEGRGTRDVKAVSSFIHRLPSIVFSVMNKQKPQLIVVAATKTVQNIGVTRPYLVGITVLTREGKRDNIHKLVLERALLAKEAGLDGVVASSQEAVIIRKDLGGDFIIVTPGIRPRGSQEGDRKRVATPAEAVADGSDFLVVGRPIVKAENPSEAAKQILKDITQV